MNITLKFTPEYAEALLTILEASAFPMASLELEVAQETHFAIVEALEDLEDEGFCEDCGCPLH